MVTTISSATMYFSYGQFHVFDASVKVPGCAWRDALFNQGFARRASTVNFGTLLEFGDADLVVHVGAYDQKSEHERVIEVPLEVVSGRVEISGPEEQPNQSVVELPVGSYRLVAAQTVKDDNREAVELYFERLAQPLTRSRIIVADEGLRPPSPLLENAEVA